MSTIEYIEDIHESFVNGQFEQAVEQIKEYGIHTFFCGYPYYLRECYSIEGQYDWYRTAVYHYMRSIE